MDLSDFLTYLDAKKAASSESTLFPWQRTVLSSLHEVKQSLRLDFVTEVMDQKKEPLERRIELFTRINRLPPSSLALVENLVSELTKIKR